MVPADRYLARHVACLCSASPEPLFTKGRDVLVAIQIRVEVHPDKRDEFLQAMADLKPFESEAGGCVSQSFYEDRERHDHFLWVEQWADRGEAETRLESDRFHALLGAVRVLGSVGETQILETADWPST